MYKTFLKGLGSILEAGVGFLPVPFPNIGTSSRFIDVKASALDILVTGIVGDATNLGVGDTVLIVTDNAVYDAEGLVVTVLDVNEIVVAIPYTIDGGAGSVTLISRA